MDDVLLNHRFLPILIIIDVFWHASFAIKQGAYVDNQNWQVYVGRSNRGSHQVRPP
jgi:hypothetical protein